MRTSPARGRRVHGISTRIATNATMPIGTLIRKIHRHVETSVIQPPSVGPITDAIPNTPATAPCTRPRSSGEYRSAMTAMVVAKMRPAPMPWTTRVPISASIDGANPAATEPITKITTATRNSGLRPNRSPNFPASGSVTVDVSR